MVCESSLPSPLPLAPASHAQFPHDRALRSATKVRIRMGFSGVIGRVGTILGESGVNVSRFHLGRRERGGEAMAVIEVDAPVETETLNQLRSMEQITFVQQIELGS